MKKILTILGGIIALNAFAASPNPFMPSNRGAPSAPTAPVDYQRIPVNPMPVSDMPALPLPPIVPPDLEDSVTVKMIGKVNGSYIFKGENSYLFEKVGDPIRIVRKANPTVTPPVVAAPPMEVQPPVEPTPPANNAQTRRPNGPRK